MPCSGIHAREWISPAVCTYVIRELVENNAANGYADQINFHFLPVTNPDGYDYTFTDVSEELAAKFYGQRLLQNVPIFSQSEQPLTQ